MNETEPTPTGGAARPSRRPSPPPSPSRTAATRSAQDDEVVRAIVVRAPAYITRPEAVYGPGTGIVPARPAARPLGRRPGRRAAGPPQRAPDRHRAPDRAGRRRRVLRGAGRLSQRLPAGAADPAHPEVPPDGRLLRPACRSATRRPRSSPRSRPAPRSRCSRQKAPTPRRSDFATTAVTATPLLYGAETVVSRQVLDGGDPSAQNMILDDMIEAYAQASETVIKTAVEAGASASGSAITAATPYAGLQANVVAYQAARFAPARGQFVPPALYTVALAQADTTGRPFFTYINPVNAGSGRGRRRVGQHPWRHRVPVLGLDHQHGGHRAARGLRDLRVEHRPLQLRRGDRPRRRPHRHLGLPRGRHPPGSLKVTAA